MSKWKISLDMGGTFTDCIAYDPSGGIHQVKVLNTGRLRGKVRGITKDGTLMIEQAWNLDKDLLQGYSFELLNEGHCDIEVLSFNPENSTMEVSEKLPQSILDRDFELYTSDEAPIFAARIVTETSKNGTLPAMDIHLGSTHGTNSLPEQKDSEPFLIITKDFGDFPQIGTEQRDHLSCLNIQKPDLLFEHVIEVKEKIGTEGDILEALSESEINKVLRTVYRSDNPLIVIILLNSHKNPVHEKTLVNILKTKGYKHVFASHQPGQVILFLPYLQNYVVNECLLPVLIEYLHTIRNKLDKNSSLKLMTSSGNFVDVTAINPKDGLLG